MNEHDQQMHEGSVEQTPEQPGGLPGLGEHIKTAFLFTRRRYDLFFWIIGGLMGLVLASAVVFAVLVYAFDSAGLVIGAARVIFGLLWVAAFVIGAFALFAAGQYAAIHRNMNVGFMESLRWTLRHIIPLAIVALYVQLVYLAGIILFVIPGLIAGVYLSLALYVYMKEEYRGLNALIRSTDLVYGSFWRVVWRILVVTVPVMIFFSGIGMLTELLLPQGGLIEFIVSMAINILSFLFTIFMFFYMAILLDGLVAEKPVFAVGAYGKLRIFYKIAMVFAVIVPTVLAFWAAQFADSMILPEDSKSAETFFTENYREGSNTLSIEDMNLLSDEKVTMLDIWYELDWHYANNERYPDALEGIIDLPSIPNEIRYESTGDGTGYLLCRVTGPESRECVTEADVNYPYAN